MATEPIERVRFHNKGHLKNNDVNRNFSRNACFFVFYVLRMQHLCELGNPLPVMGYATLWIKTSNRLLNLRWGVHDATQRPKMAMQSNRLPMIF
jgi:hypothetical protein